MKRQAREVYGFGQRFPTRNGRAVWFARVALVLFVAATAAALAVQS